MTPIVQ